MLTPIVTKVLVAENDLTLLDTLTQNLTHQGCQVLCTSDGQNVLYLARREKPDLVLIDPRLPELGGATICSHLRRESDARIVLLAVRDNEMDVILALDDGADDFIVKPFSLGELYARMYAVMRRGSREPKTKFASGDLVLDLVAHRAWRNGEPMSLPRKEFYLLAELIRNKGIALNRKQLLERVWGG